MSTPSTLAQTRDALLDVLRAVPAVGVVHGHERYASNELAFRAAYLYTHANPTADAFGSQPHVRGWYVRRTATREVTEAGRVLNEHTWLVRGYLTLNDALGSELIFDELVERMREAVRWNTALGLPGLLGSSGQAQRGVQVQSAGPVLFAGLLCHSAALELVTRNWVQRRVE